MNFYLKDDENKRRDWLFAAGITAFTGLILAFISDYYWPLIFFGIAIFSSAIAYYKTENRD